VTITRTDANGYKQWDSGAVQRLSISIDGGTDYAINVAGGVGFGAGVRDITMDIVCWQHCFDLTVGSKHIMGSDSQLTSYDGTSVPYVSIGNARWQILEKCSTSAVQCIVASTLDRR
jgi:hypothetical protein